MSLHLSQSKTCRNYVWVWAICTTAIGALSWGIVCMCVCIICYQILIASCVCCIFITHHDSGSARLSLTTITSLIPNTNRTLWKHSLQSLSHPELTAALSTCVCVCVCIHIHSCLLSQAAGPPNKLPPSPLLDSSSCWLYWTNEPAFVKLKPKCPVGHHNTETRHSAVPQRPSTVTRERFGNQQVKAMN